MEHPGQAGASWSKKGVTPGAQERVKATPKGLEPVLHEEESFGVPFVHLPNGREGARLFPVEPSDRTSSNRHKLDPKICLFVCLQRG